MGMTQTSKAQQTMTAEPMLTPGEIRTHTHAVSGETVSVYSVAGGSFTHVRVAGADGRTLYSRNYISEREALARFAELKGN